ncbi:trypsin-like peptidase domain-containing protein [Sulfitobacter sp. D35]|uniref:trypsin-like peptidase domain-containing protein n=1 Tax=Sulfitobacter sp. D35 TaxID=3083252 RepID=UPI00296E6AB8|nr:trypsin-like peptidase domain-containing protein [Sulfitobacter sp. D35]MDW4500456.1 trypsin-like peptidase domain-containing protein [Sulfitobacter sp. D35]
MLRTILLTLCLATPLCAEQVKIPQSRAEMQLSFVPLVKQATPAVVNIYARIMAEPQRTPLQRDPFFRRFFGDPEAVKPRVQNSLGSGVILSSDGIIVSNHHVVGMATDIRVALSDRREYTARVLLADEDSDLAILKIDAEDLPHLPLRDSDTVEVGELVLAIGNPFGVGQTVSSGIVSGLARSGGGGGSGRGYYIQTDAPINPGNSGGALIDTEGRLIGINTSILSRSGGSNGIGFAIPADLVGAFVAQARAGKGYFERPWAGMRGQPVDSDLALSIGLDPPGGLIVSDRHDASPFAAAGVDVGDVITAVNGQPVNTASEMVYRMSVIGLGKAARITRFRDGAFEDVEVLLIAAPDDPPREEMQLGRRSILPGLTLSRINPAVTAANNLPFDAEGVLVLDAGDVAPRVGFRDGDVILAINGASVTRPAEVRDAFDLRLRGYDVTVQRGARRLALRFRV